MNFRKTIREDNIGFQIAPMIDIVFLILIFFISASIYAQWESKIGIKVPTAKSGDNPPRYPGEVIINIAADGKIFLNSVEYSFQRLSATLPELAKMYPDQPVTIRADRETRYENVIMVLDLCRKMDIGNISFATMPEKMQKTGE